MLNAIKETYVRECQKKLGVIRDSRAQQANAQAAQNMGQPAFQQGQHLQQMGQNLPFQPQLQHQMQASPIPQSQGQHLGMTGSPAMNMQAGAGVGPGARGVQQQQPNNFIPNQQQPRPNQQAGPLKITPQDNDAINRIAHQMVMATSVDDKRKIQQNIMSTMSEEQLQNMRVRGIDPVAVYIRDRAVKQWKAQQSAGSGNPNFTPNMQMNPAMAQRQGQLAANMTGPQGGRGMPGTGPSAGPPFLNVDHIQGMQEQGLRSQEQGQLVVPASNVQGINPEQFRLQQFVNNQQRAKQNPAGGVNPQFMSQQPQPPPTQPDQSLQQAHQEKTNNTVGLQGQSQVQAPANTPAMAPQQVGMQNLQGLQGMSQSGTPLSMLTRPVGTNVQGPGPSQSQGTPQGRPPSRAPNSTQQPTPQMQHNFPQGGQQNNSQQPGMHPQMFSQLPQQWQQQLQGILSKYPREQWNNIIARFKATRPSRFQSGALPMSQTLSQPGANQPTANGQNLGSSIPMQHSASAGAPVSQGSSQGMSPNPPTMPQQQQQQQQPQRRPPNPNQSNAPQMPNQAAPTAMALQGNSLPDMSPEDTAYMDEQPVPQHLIHSIVQRYGVPSQVKTWSNLKQYVNQTLDSALPVDKIFAVQKLQFQQMRQLMRGQNRSMANQSHPFSAQPGAGPQPAPQVRPNFQNQSHTVGPQQNQLTMKMIGNLPPITTEEIQRVRMANPSFDHVSDDQIRQYLTAVRQSEARKRLGLTQPQNSQQMTFMPGQNPAQPGPPGMRGQQPPQAGIPPGNPAGENAQIRSGMQGSRSQSTPAPRPASQAASQPQIAGTIQPSKGVKRANEDEVIEVSNRNVGKNSALPQQAGGAQQTPPFRVLSREELSRMSPEQQKAYRERHNQHQQQIFYAHMARLTEEVRRTSQALHPISMDAADRARIVKVLTAPGTKQMLVRFNALLFQYFLMTRNQEQVKQLLSYRIHLLSQYSSASIKANTWEPAEQFSITADYAEGAIKDVIAHFNHVLMSRAAPQQPAGSAPPPTEASGSHPLSADNLKRHQDMQAAQRATKRPAQDVPPAPTASQPPFTFESSPRGQGTPRYAAAGLKQGLKQEDLKLPSKRQKKNHQDNAASTPAGGHPTPAVSPQMMKGKKQDELPFKCAKVGCEYHDKGFTTKGDLDNHSNTVHKPVEEHIDDPLAFFLDSTRNGLGLDENGESRAKPTTQAPKAVELQKTASRGAGLASKPATPASAGVAMARGVSQISGPKAGSPSLSHLTEAKSGPAKGTVGGASTDNAAWETSNVSLSDLQNTFGDLASKGPSVSLTQHDPLSANNDVADFMDQFMESDAWTKMQETAVNAEEASSKATESPAQLSDRGQGNSDMSKGDDLFIKIGAEDTELAESWALPELRIEPEANGECLDETDEWIKMDFGDVSTEDIANADDMDFEWKEVDWEKLLAEQDTATAVPGKK